MQDIKQQIVYNLILQPQAGVVESWTALQCICLWQVCSYWALNVGPLSCRARKSKIRSRCQQAKEQTPEALASNTMDDVPVPTGSAWSAAEVHGYHFQEEYLALNDISDVHDYDYPMPDYVNCV